MTNKLYKLFILNFFLLFSSIAFGQIKAPTADRVDSTAYINDSILGTDPIYVFYTPNRNGHLVGGELVASFNDTIYADYTWFKYSTFSSNFIQVYEEDSVATSSYKQTIFSEGAYQLHIVDTTNNIDTLWYAWIALNNFDLSFPTINNNKTNCQTMGLTSNLDFEYSFDYFDLLETDSVLTIENDIDSLFWTTTERFPHTLPESLTPVFQAPTVPTKFTITVEDAYGYRVEKYIDVTEEEPLDSNGKPWLRAVKAEFFPSLYANDPSDTVSSVTGQAPLKVQFTNSSENVQNYYWTFYNDDIRIAGELIDSIKYETTEIRPLDSILYDFQGDYTVKLEVEGPTYYALGTDTQCEDVSILEKCVLVDTVYLPTLMNVFTPNGDNQNDLFYFENYPGKETSSDFNEPTSIKEFSIKIYSRWGSKVHDFEGAIEDWQGWDGDTPGIGKAKTGVYYYHAIYSGYGNNTHDDPTGFIHLFR